MPGIYLHIPFCRRKCYYCDFFSVGSRRAPWDEYVAALLREADLRVGEWGRYCSASATPRTLYVGGGTPSQMPAALLTSLIIGVKERFGLEMPDELTVEVNPEDVDVALVEGMREAGVNRVSMGVQTLSDIELKAIGRRHTARKALESYALLRDSFANISLDLIFGLPLQTFQSWQESVTRIVELQPEHLSVYSLMWEERAALTRMRALGKVEECDEQLALRMYAHLSASLAAAGYEHYEISSYCRPGYASLHNSSYWAGVPYVGLGAGAHSYDGERLRRSNACDIAAYMSTGAQVHTEHLSDEELREEYILTRLRCRRGILMSDYAARFGRAAAGALLRKAASRPELLHADDSRIYLLSEGVMRSDAAILALL